MLKVWSLINLKNHNNHYFECICKEEDKKVNFPNFERVLLFKNDDKLQFFKENLSKW